jgi:hypothetical protein
VEYEIKAGEELPVWRGPAASQKLNGTDCCLEGGGEQIVFYPVRDEMVSALQRVDRETGDYFRYGSEIDNRVEFIDITGEMVPTKLRKRVTDPHIRGPMETGWGASDYSSQEARRILLTVPK